jgi:hypothetical protein
VVVVSYCHSKISSVFEVVAGVELVREESVGVDGPRIKNWIDAMMIMELVGVMVVTKAVLESVMAALR